MKLKSLLGALLFGLLLAPDGAFAQGVGSSGDIKGTVRDSSGAVLSRATVVVVAVEKGIRRTTVTDGSGEYHLTGLPPTIYSASAERSGFQTEIQKDVVVNVGQTAIVDFHLKVSQVTTVIEVNAEPPVVETERGHQADTVNERYVRGLPIDRRDYLTFTLLMPGVADSRTLADNTDFRVVQTPQSGLSFHGSNGRGNSVIVDGGEANDNTGGVRLTLGQDAVQEFQINRSNYSAELGAASGASINIVTRSGSNQIRGSAFAFFRNDALDAGDPFAFGPALKPGDPFVIGARAQRIKPSLNRQQFGGALGFPLRKDRTFLFVSYEGLRRDEQTSVPLLTDTSIFAPTAGQAAILAGLQAQGGALVPCINGQPNFPAAVCAGVLSNLLTVNPALGPRDSFVVTQFEQNSGVFPFSSTSDLASARLDHQFGDRNQLRLRYNFGRAHERNPNVQALNAFSRGNLVEQLDSTIQGAWYHQFSSNFQNEARVQWNYSTLRVIPNDPGGPGLDVPGFGFFGRNIFLPSVVTNRRYEFADNLTLIRGHHTVKMGGYLLLHGDRADSHTFFAGRFSFGQLPGFVLSPCLANPATNCGLSGLLPTTVSALQSFKLGLPQFYQQGFGDPVVAGTTPFLAGYWQDSWSLRPNFTLNFGLRYEVDVRNAPLHTDKNNVAPRVSFAWDPFEDRKTVVRGGYGIFYSPIYYQIDYVVRALGNVNGFRQIPQVFVPLTGAPSSAAIFQTLFAQGLIACGTPNTESCITASNLTQFGINITQTGPVPPLSVLFSGADDFRNPYSQQAEVGIEREVSPGFVISASYIYSHTLGLPRARDKNLLPAPVLPAGPVGIAIQRWNAPSCQANPFSCFVNPLLLQDNVYESTAGALYHGGILELKKRFSNHFTLLANYSYSKALDDSTDYNSDFEANDQLELRNERALSAFDQRHKVVIAGILESPWKGGRDASVVSRILAGFTVAPVFRGNSSRPFNLLAGTDVNGDRHPTTDRPPGAGRNTGHGPDFWTFDLRLTHKLSLGEQRSLQFVFEVFDLSNRTNFSRVNNTVGVIGPPFNLSSSDALSPSQPLGYTAAFPRREIQLGVRLNF